MAESYVRTALTFREIDEQAFFDQFGGQTARVCLGFPSTKADEVAEWVLQLHRRHGREIWDVLKSAVERHSADIVDRSLPATSLLAMTAAGSQRLVELRPDKIATAFDTWVSGEDATCSSAEDNGGARELPSRGGKVQPPTDQIIRSAPRPYHGAKTIGIREAIKDLWTDRIPEGLSAKERNNAICEWLELHGYSVPANPARAVQRVLREGRHGR